jgi:hypothetical protein
VIAEAWLLTEQTKPFTLEAVFDLPQVHHSPQPHSYLTRLAAKSRVYDAKE